MSQSEKKYDVVIIGAGVIGCSIAYFLTQESERKLKIVVLDKNGIGGEASAGAAGMLASQIETESPGPFFNLCTESRALFPNLAEELLQTCGVDIEYLASGILSLAYTDQEAESQQNRINWQKNLGLECEWLSQDKIAQRLPFLAKEPLGGFWSARDGQVSSNRLTMAFAESAKKLGVDFYEQQDVGELNLKTSQLVSLQTKTRKFSADRYIFSAGSWTGKILKNFVPVKPVKGQILIFKTPKNISLWESPIFCGSTPDGIHCYLVPKKDGHLYVGATDEDCGFDKEENEEATKRLSQYVSELFPEISNSPWKGVWVGLRPDTPDHLPILGQAPGFKNVFVASGHYRNGILLAPISGKILAELILKGKSTFPIEPFSPVRFSQIPSIKRHARGSVAGASGRGG